MEEFLLFKTFITPTLLLIIYYIGALIIPILSWYIAGWIKNHYIAKVNIRLTLEQRSYVFIAFLICLLSMEIFWRVVFEFFIAYFDMHDALMRMS